jgi:hypothetical protein
VLHRVNGPVIKKANGNSDKIQGMAMVSAIKIADPRSDPGIET